MAEKRWPCPLCDCVFLANYEEVLLFHIIEEHLRDPDAEANEEWNRGEGFFYNCPCGHGTNNSPSMAKHLGEQGALLREHLFSNLLLDRRTP